MVQNVLDKCLVILVDAGSEPEVDEQILVSGEQYKCVSVRKPEETNGVPINPEALISVEIEPI